MTGLNREYDSSALWDEMQPHNEQSNTAIKHTLLNYCDETVTELILVPNTHTHTDRMKNQVSVEHTQSPQYE